MLVHDYDDEHTMEEEEALSNAESVGNELDGLAKVYICAVCLRYICNSSIIYLKPWLNIYNLTFSLERRCLAKKLP